MRVRFYQVWWLGVALFVPSVMVWLGAFVWSICIGRFQTYFDSYGLCYMYLPMLAATIGVAFPLLMLRKRQSLSHRAHGFILAGYCAVLVAWGSLDVRLAHCQLSGNHCAGDPFDFCHYYPKFLASDSHVYFTWYFLPYRLIEPADWRT